MADKEVPKGRIGRTLPLVGLAGRTVATRARSRGRADVAADLKRQQKLAERYTAVLGEMKGAVMKAGQILSFIDAEGLMPPEYQEMFQATLSSLQDNVPPLSSDEVMLVVESELGQPVGTVFSSFSPEPIAAASIGQVHRARLPSGAEVVVKVQYPGVAEAIGADLANTDLLVSIVRAGMSLLGGAAPRVDPKAVVAEVRDRVVEELDYRMELANQQEFERIYEDHPCIKIPRVHPETSTGRILTMDYVEGMRWAEALTQDPELRQRWAEVIYRFVFGSLHRHGIFNGDPHPGNYLFHPDGTVTFIDFGCVKRFSDDHVAILNRLLDATIRADADGLLQAFVDLGMLGGKDAQQIDASRLLDFYRHTLSALWEEQPFTYTPEFAADVVGRSYEPFGDWYDVTSRFQMPQDLVFLNRINIGVCSILGRLRAKADWPKIDAELRYDGPAAGFFGDAEIAWRQAGTGR